MTEKANRRTIYSGEPLERLLAGRADESGLRSVSGVVNMAADRYLEIVRRSMPIFAVSEWALLFDSLNGVWMQDHAGTIGGALSLGVRDSIGLDGLDRKWEVDGPALCTKLDALSYSAQVAVIDAAERFWAAPNAGDLHETIADIVGDRCVENADETTE